MMFSTANIDPVLHSEACCRLNWWIGGRKVMEWMPYDQLIQAIVTKSTNTPPQCRCACALSAFICVIACCKYQHVLVLSRQLLWLSTHGMFFLYFSPYITHCSPIEIKFQKLKTNCILKPLCTVTFRVLNGTITVNVYSNPGNVNHMALVQQRCDRMGSWLLSLFYVEVKKLVHVEFRAAIFSTPSVIQYIKVIHS